MHLLAFLAPALALASPAALPFFEAVTPPPDQITIIDTQTSGTGCPQGSVSTIFSPDRTIVTFGFDSFVAFIGPTSNPPDETKNCQIHMSLKYPGGFQYSLMDATYHGFAQLDPGVTGHFASTYYFSNNASNTAKTNATISGGDYVDGAQYTKHDVVAAASVVWSPCGETGILNVNNRIWLTALNRNQRGSLSDDDATVSFTQQVHIIWQACRK
ncbi:hypothetical protein EJ06DRAFT_517786 [Trichodelitschia bisporula]|uniref:Secreted protein n=1 Tax=Trichodelitschia bisporula TaxID=703511 RepID=A0A6G1HI68_9PEZI|nr:hypothetical protein EJ06DRAFT_517786 [Trichodelitschia bisporula]